MNSNKSRNHLKNLYNKGKYRGHEYGKIPKYMKQRGNKLWRRDFQNVLDDFLNEDALVRTTRSWYRKHLSREIKLKITLARYSNKKYSRYTRYKTLKDAKNSIKRNSVINYHFTEQP